MNRRRFLRQSARVFPLALLPRATAAPPAPFGKLVTVTGPVDPPRAGTMLPHEHVMSTFGSPAAETAAYDRSTLLGAVLPYLRKIRSLGCSALADCTAVYFGRDPVLLREISEKSGILILTNTGYYGAAGGRYIPDHARTESVDQIAARWISESERGIAGTRIRPGFIKLGFDAGPLSDLSEKLLRAAARTHLKTGLVIAAHTGNNPDGVHRQLKLLREEGVSPSAWIWVHANSVESAEPLLEAARAGAWIELDGVRPETTATHLELLGALRGSGFLGRVLLSHDGNSHRPGDFTPKPYHSLFTDFIPTLHKEGYRGDEVRQLIAGNPQEAFTLRVRRDR